MDDELQPFPIGDAGVQPELLADVVQPRGRSQGGNSKTHHPGDGSLTVSVSVSQDLAPCRKSRRQLQRPLRGGVNLPPTDGSFAVDQTWRASLSPCSGRGGG